MAHPLSPVRITRLEPAGPDAWTVYWPRTFRFQPGQVVALSTSAEGPQRLYSLATGCDDAEAGVLFNLATDGWLTPQLARAEAGQTLFVSQPFGSFVGIAGPSIWVANGTGVAPFLSMVLSGLTAHKTLVQGARTRAFFYGQNVLSSALGERYHRCASADTGPDLEPGRLTAYLERVSWSPDVPVYLCGSAAMIVDARDVLIRAGVPFQKILSEVYF